MESRDITLPNGMRVYLLSTNTFPIIKAELDLKLVGPAVEEAKLNGITHFVEHMIFEGCELYPDRDQFDIAIERLGGSFNGYTSFSTMGASITVPDTELDLAINYLYSIAFEAKFYEANIERERGAILDELHNVENRPYKRFSDFFDRYRYTKGNVPPEIAGKKQTVKSFKRADLLDWYEKIFNPSNMIFTIVGQFNLDIAEEKLLTKFRDVKSRQAPFTLTDFKDGEYAFADGVVKTQVEAKEKLALGSITLPGLSLQNSTYEERQHYKIIAYMLANARSSRLFKKLRKDTGTLYDIGASAGWGVKTGVFDISFSTSTEKVKVVYDTIMNEMRSLKDEGFSQEEIEFARDGAINNLKMGFGSIHQILGWAVSHLESIGRVPTLEEVIKVREEITRDQVNEMINKIFLVDKMAVISRVPDKKSVKEINSVDFKI